MSSVRSEERNPRRCAIIGAGASGLPSARWAAEYGYEPVVFERDDEVGGLWHYKPQHTEMSTVMKATVINSSKEMTAYSDFPPDKNLPNYMHNTDLLQYYIDYAKHFDLYKFIRFKHTVTAIRRAANYDRAGEWTVEFVEQTTGQKHEEKFECVLLCVGHHTTPNMPARDSLWPGLSEFKGRVIHSHSYKDHVGYEDKVVVVVGIGNSAVEIAVELGHVAKKVYLSTRRGAWVNCRVGPHGYPNDMVLITRFNVCVLQAIVPNAVAEWAVTRELQARFDHHNYGLKPAHGFFSQHGTINDELPNRIISGTVVVKPDIREIRDSNTVVFDNGTTVENVDEIVLGTGYKFHFNLVEEGALIPVEENYTPLYKFMFPAQLLDHNTLAIIGHVQPVGSLMPIAEMQARLFFEQITGGIKLPSKQEMLNDIEQKRMALERRYVKSPRHTMQVDHVPFLDELAEMIGAKPRVLPRLLTDPRLALNLLFEANVAYVYRLDGPRPWRGAREAILGTRERAEGAQRTRVLQKPSKSTQNINYFCVFSIAAVFFFYFLSKLFFDQSKTQNA